jgi:type IV pilus assembly protein PilW
VTARIFLLVRSINPVTGYVNDKTYNLGSKTIAAKNDAFYRRVYSTTVQLRNSEKLQMSASD